jgi:hypothetical protein
MNWITKNLKEWQFTLSIGSSSELFIKILYSVLLWSTIKLLLIGNVVWGEDYFILLSDPFSGPDRLAMLLNIPAVRIYYLYFVLPFLGLILAGLLGFHNVYTRIVVWFLFVNLHFGNGAVSTGGHHLIQQLLFFHIFLFRVKSEEVSYLSSLGRFIHHLAYYSIWLQIAILYLVSGIWKLKGDLWLDGSAMFLTLSFKEFGFPWIANTLKENTIFLQILTWMVLAYQVLFIALVWIKPIRKWVLLFGAAFHISIIFLIGITDFGLFMIASYSIFINNDLAEKILRKIRLRRVLSLSA